MAEVRIRRVDNAVWIQLRSVALVRRMHVNDLLHEILAEAASRLGKQYGVSAPKFEKR